MQKLWPVEVCRQKLPKQRDRGGAAGPAPTSPPFLTENLVRRGVASSASHPLFFFTDGTGKENLSPGKGCDGGNEGGGGSGQWMRWG
jgi:hypothetical protein